MRPEIKIPSHSYGYILKVSDDKFEGVHPNGIDEGYSTRGIIWRYPEIGERCEVGILSTSPVTEVNEIENGDTIMFKTLNSTYCLLKFNNKSEYDFYNFVTHLMRHHSETLEEIEKEIPFYGIATTNAVFSRLNFIKYNEFTSDYNLTISYEKPEECIVVLEADIENGTMTLTMKEWDEIEESYHLINLNRYGDPYRKYTGINLSAFDVIHTIFKNDTVIKLILDLPFEQFKEELDVNLDALGISLLRVDREDFTLTPIKDEHYKELHNINYD